MNKGIWNDGTQQVDWTDVATLSPQTVVYGDYNGTDAKNAQVNGWNIAFSPDGQTGYAVIIGKEYDGIPCGPMPLVWKSIDGGDTWNQLPNHDFSQATLPTPRASSSQTSPPSSSCTPPHRTA